MNPNSFGTEKVRILVESLHPKSGHKGHKPTRPVLVVEILDWRSIPFGHGKI